MKKLCHAKFEKALITGDSLFIQESREDEDSKKDWGFNDWLKYQKEVEENYKRKQEEIFGRVKGLLAAELGGEVEGEEISNPAVRGAWERRKRREEEDKNKVNYCDLSFSISLM